MVDPDVPSSSMAHPFHIIESLDLPPLDDDTHVPRSIHPAHCSGNTGGIDSTTMMPSSTPGTFPPTPKATGAVHIRYTAERCASSDRPDFLSSPSPTPVPDDMLQTESHSPIPAPATPGMSRQWPPSVPDLGVAAEGDGSAEVALHKKKGAVYPPLVIHENTMSIPELPSQSPSPRSANDVAIAGASRRSLDAEHTGDLPHSSHDQYDIV
ncbi:hypothetical protein EDB89DRAFT_286687 [Lactarius sanguifluus]|nr:hypothetical protein EDB89DRAFT_483808 [Lactarius sanguifluus]KAH9175808.1 hypothetical protein EDB89DRAFT_286687 [Lactarius sanguifluus]